MQFIPHNLEHLFAHEIEPTLNGFYRILKDDEVFIACPDLEGVAKHIVNGNLTEPIYESPAGPIAPIDIIYGHRRSLKAGRHYMAHKCGFTIKVLLGVLKNCGFNSGAGSTDGISIWVNAIKPEDKLKEIENRFLSSHGRRSWLEKNFPWATLYLNDAFNFKDGRLMGRHAAGKSYLRAIAESEFNCRFLST